MADATDLLNVLNNSAQISAAKYGGYGKTSKLGGLLDILLPAYQAAFPKAPAANLAMGARQAYNVNQYNKSLQAQAELARQRQTTTDTNNASIYNRRTGMNVSGPFDVALANSSAPDIRNDNAKPSLNRLLQGEALTLDPNANYDDALIRDYAGQQSKATNYLNQNSGLGAIASGQGQSLIGKALQNFQNEKMAQAGLDGNMLSAGASYSRPARQIDTGMSPYMLPTDIPSQIAGNQRAGLDDAQAQGQQIETKRHNIIGETETARNHRATESIGRTNANAHMISARKPSGSGSMNPYTIPNAAQNFAQGQIDAIDKELKGLGYVGEGGKLKPVAPNSPGGLFGWGAHTQTQQEQRAQQLMDMRNQLQTQILPASTPFKGQSTTKLKNASSNVIKGSKGSYVIPD